MRVRRLALVAVLAVIAGVSLTGCRSEPAVAAYLGDRKITVDEVAGIVTAVNDVADRRTALIARVRAEQLAFINSGEPDEKRPEIPEDAQKPVVRTDARQVLSLIVCAEVGQRIVAEKSLSAPAVAPEAFAGLFGLPASDRFVQLWSAYFTTYRAVMAQGRPKPLTEEQADELYTALDETGQAPKDFDAQVGANPALGALFQTRQVYGDAIRSSGASFNPRYGQLVLPVVDDSIRPIGLPFPGDSGVPVDEA
jgi:hypothetical protein